MPEQRTNFGAHVLLIMSRDSCVLIGQELLFHGLFSLIYCLHLSAIGRYWASGACERDEQACQPPGFCATKRRELQMGCLSSGDLKEEKT